MRYLILFLLLGFSHLHAELLQLKSEPQKKCLRTVGTIERDVTHRLILESPVSGVVEKLFVDEVDKKILAMEPLAEIFSPELYGAEVAYLCALQTQVVELIEPALAHLMALQVPQEELVRLTESCEAKRTFTINAPTMARLLQSDLQTGQLVQKGQPLFFLEDPTAMLVVVQVYEEEVPLLKVGEKVSLELPSFLDSKVEAQIAAISQTKDPKTRASQVHLAFSMPEGKLHTGTFCIARIEVEMEQKSLSLPLSALLSNKERPTVNVAIESGQFEERVIVLGARRENCFEVLQGLQEGEIVQVTD